MWTIAHVQADRGLEYPTLDEAVRASKSFVTPRNIRLISPNGIRLTVEAAEILVEAGAK